MCGRRLTASTYPVLHITPIAKHIPGTSEHTVTQVAHYTGHSSFPFIGTAAVSRKKNRRRLLLIFIRFHRTLLPRQDYSRSTSPLSDAPHHDHHQSTSIIHHPTSRINQPSSKHPSSATHRPQSVYPCLRYIRASTLRSKSVKKSEFPKCTYDRIFIKISGFFFLRIDFFTITPKIPKKSNFSEIEFPNLTENSELDRARGDFCTLLFRRSCSRRLWRRRRFLCLKVKTEGC